MISSAGLKDVDFQRLARTTPSLSTVAYSFDNSLAAKASDSASRAKAVVLSLDWNDQSGLPFIVITPLGPGILSFMCA